MDTLMKKKEGLLQDYEDFIKTLKEGDNDEIKEIILKERRKLYRQIRVNIPHNMRKDEIF